MDIAGLWRGMRAGRADAFRVGAHLETEGAGITISVAQECQIALPPRRNRIPAVSVTVTSQRPGVAAQVTIAANFNSPDGSYQGPTTSSSARASSPKRAWVLRPVSSCCRQAFLSSASAPSRIGPIAHTALP